jgi:catechol 2,3-dioxygenase-like lactoylglutathione lyase family enzyme
VSELSFESRTVFCRDVAASASYYEAALGFRRAFESGGDVGLTVPVAGDQRASITLYLHAATTPDPVDLGTFRVADVDAFIERYRAAGHRVDAEPADTPWGTREASISDSDGNGLIVSSTP